MGQSVINPVNTANTFCDLPSLPGGLWGLGPGEGGGKAGPQPAQERDPGHLGEQPDREEGLPGVWKAP